MRRHSMSTAVDPIIVANPWRERGFTLVLLLALILIFVLPGIIASYL